MNGNCSQTLLKFNRLGFVFCFIAARLSVFPISKHQFVHIFLYLVFLMSFLKFYVSFAVFAVLCVDI